MESDYETESDVRAQIRDMCQVLQGNCWAGPSQSVFVCFRGHCPPFQTLTDQDASEFLCLLPVLGTDKQGDRKTEMMDKSPPVSNCSVTTDNSGTF